jgi:hypothetical protein
MLVGLRAKFCPACPCAKTALKLFYVIKFWNYFVARAYIVHVYAKRTCINAYLTMTRTKGSKVLSSHCVQRGL